MPVTEEKVPREDSCESYGCAIVTAHDHVVPKEDLGESYRSTAVTVHAHSPHLAERSHFLESDWIIPVVAQLQKNLLEYCGNYQKAE